MKHTLTLFTACCPPLAALLSWLILLGGGKFPPAVAEQPVQGMLSAASYPSIQAALDAKPGRMVYVPAGDHMISEKIRIHDDNGGLCGPGRIIQTNANAPIIEIVKAAGVQLRDLTLTRAEGKMETRLEGVQAINCRDLVLENLRVLDNHSSRAAIGLHECDGGQVRGCLVRNSTRIAMDDRTKEPHTVTHSTASPVLASRPSTVRRAHPGQPRHRASPPADTGTEGKVSPRPICEEEPGQGNAR